MYQLSALNIQYRILQIKEIVQINWTINIIICILHEFSPRPSGKFYDLDNEIKNLYLIKNILKNGKNKGTLLEIWYLQNFEKCHLKIIGFEVFGALANWGSKLKKEKGLSGVVINLKLKVNSNLKIAANAAMADDAMSGRGHIFASQCPKNLKTKKKKSDSEKAKQLISTTYYASERST